MVRKLKIILIDKMRISENQNLISKGDAEENLIGTEEAGNVKIYSKNIDGKDILVDEEKKEGEKEEQCPCLLDEIKDYAKEMNGIECEFTKEGAVCKSKKKEENCRFYCYYCCPVYGMCAFCYETCHKDCPRDRKFTERKGDTTKCACAYYLMHQSKNPPEKKEEKKEEEKEDVGCCGSSEVKENKENKENKEEDSYNLSNLKKNFRFENDEDFKNFLYEKDKDKDLLKTYFMDWSSAYWILNAAGKIMRKKFISIKPLDFNDFKYGKWKEICLHRKYVNSKLDDKTLQTIKAIVNKIYKDTSWCAISSLKKFHLIILFEIMYFGLTYSLYNQSTLAHFIKVMYKLIEERIRYGKVFDVLSYIGEDGTSIEYTYHNYMNAIGKLLFMALNYYNSFIYEKNSKEYFSSKDKSEKKYDKYTFEVDKNDENNKTNQKDYGIRIESLIQMMRIIHETQSSEL
ncbi:MAG: hypothetical protein MJ252_30500, partial [archaeon]|nr:hypothetical protein [archaeon]